jgi:putative copper resistance protein D
LASVLYIIAAVGMLAAALSPQIDARADAAFSWHMAQHLVLLFLVPFCLVAARPFQLFSAFARKGVVARVVRVTRPMHVAAHPVVALAFFGATMWATHFSGLYELALEHTWAHVAEHTLYLSAGVLFWLPVLAPQPLRPLPYPMRLLYLFVALPQGALLAFALASGHRALYPHYAQINGTAAALADQTTAAAVMWIAGGLIVFVAFLATLGVWAARENAADERLAGFP